MTPRVAVLRPEPGNRATCARLAAAGFEALSLPLFAVRPLGWDVPDGADHDALLITSANTIRHGGPNLARLRALPVLAVGTTTARAAAEAGFDVMAAGSGAAAAILATGAGRGLRRILHLGGAARSIAAGGIVTRALAVYASEPLPIAAADVARLAGTVALLHSARAAERLGGLLDESGIARGDIAIAALSPAIRTAAGDGWCAAVAATAPNDADMIAALRTLLD